MAKPEDFWNNDTSVKTCVHCTNANGSIKSCEEIFAWWVHFFMNTTGADRALAERLVRKNMLRLPYWKVLSGEVASDEEFEEVMKGL